MKKTLQVFVMALLLVGVVGLAANAGTWYITEHYSYYYYSSWSAVQSYTNTSYTQTDSYTYVHSDSRTVTVSAEVGLSDVVEASIGFSAGQTISDSFTFNVNVAPRTKRTLYCRWAILHHYGLANYYQDSWNPFDGSDKFNVYWNEDVPDYLDGTADEVAI